VMRRLGSPNAAFCFGRDLVCEEIMAAAMESGAVLLFGGRQAGKTTVLLRIEDKWKPSPQLLVNSPLVVPTLINLQELAPDEGVSGLYRCMVKRAVDACALILPSDIALQLTPKEDMHFTFDRLIMHLSAVVRAIERSDVYLIFLVDETKRIFNKEYSRGLQDNLFALIWGEHQLAGRIAMVFAGAQELFEFSVDETSPIGSRAAVQILENLDEESLMAMAEGLGIDAGQSRITCAKEAYYLGGGATRLIPSNSCSLHKYSVSG